MLITAKKSNLYPIGYGRLISSYDLNDKNYHVRLYYKL